MFLAALAAPLLVLAACDAAAPSSASDALEAEATPTADARHGTRGLSAVRRATARYHRVDRAVADGWGAVAVSECVEHPVLGGMGHHYVHLGHLFDGGALDPATPEALLYEPQKNGRLRLVAVEYIVSFDDESRPGDGGTAPELFGQTFHPSEPAGGWALHVWAWRHNPAGMFEDFNPRVSCEHAE